MMLQLFLIASLLTAQQPPAEVGAKRTVEVVRTITEKQRERPFWFVLGSPFLESIPFAYRVSTSRTSSGGGECGVVVLMNVICKQSSAADGDAASPAKGATTPESKAM